MYLTVPFNLYFQYIFLSQECLVTYPKNAERPLSKMSLKNELKRMKLSHGNTRIIKVKMSKDSKEVHFGPKIKWPLKLSKLIRSQNN